MRNEGRFSKRDRERARQAGLKGGNRSYELRVGTHSKTSQEKREYTMLGLKSRGKKPWTQDEYAFLSVLINDPDYRIKSGTRKGMYDNVAMARELNDFVHNGRQVRTVNAIKNATVKLLEMMVEGEAA